jgi:hypothetical protein
MTMRLFFVAAFVLTSIAVSAQSKISFSSQNYAGLLEGEYGSKFQLQTINGFTYKNWFAGLGTGIDWYYRRSIPAFVSVSKSFLKKESRSFFITAGGGVNFPWKDEKDFNAWGYSIEKMRPGVYYEAGFGYKIGIGKKNDAAMIQLGYSYKHVGEKAKNRIVYYYSYSILPGPQPSEYTNEFDYYLRRVSLKLGWSF